MTSALQTILDAGIGKESRDGESIIVGYGSAGYLRIVDAGDGDIRIKGKLSRRNGGTHATLKEQIADATGIRAYS